jgi:hypothetical protein
MLEIRNTRKKKKRKKEKKKKKKEPRGFSRSNPQSLSVSGK